MKVWQKAGLVLASLAVSAVAMADPTGTWRTIDDATGKAKSLVRITNEGGNYVGRIQKMLTGTDICDPCSGALEGKNLIGQTILWGVEHEEGNQYDGGRIRDPKNGKTYSAALTDNGSTLKVRGYMGSKLLGRTQVWQRVN